MIQRILKRKMYLPPSSFIFKDIFVIILQPKMTIHHCYKWEKHDCHYLQIDVKCLIIFFKVCFRTWPSSLLRILVQYTVGILNWHLGFKKCPERNPNNESEDSSLVSQVWSVSQFFLWKKTMKFLWIRPII